MRLPRLGLQKSIVLMTHSRERSPNIPISKRSTKRWITIKDHKTSVSLENEFWDCLREIAVERGVSLGALVAAIDTNRQHANLSSAIEFLSFSFIGISFVERPPNWEDEDGGSAAPSAPTTHSRTASDELPIPFVARFGCPIPDKDEPGQ